jgi:hypothetical protein
MTNLPNSPDLAAIAYEAQIEISVAETIQAAEAVPGGTAHAFDTAEIGYHEVEFKSLPDAATTLNEAEQLPESRRPREGRCRGQWHSRRCV